MKISIVLPAYKEEENLKVLLPKLNKMMQSFKKEYEILIIDTMTSMDNTKEVCIENNAVYVNRRGGNSYGDAMRTGFAEAKGEYIVVMDADGSHNCEDIRRFYATMKKGNYDLVIGSRYMKGGETDNNFILRFMSLMVNVAYRIIFHLNVADVSDSYRMYNAEKLKSIECQCDNFDIVEEILIRLKVRYPDFKIKEVPITFNKRMYGESKRDLVKFIFSYLETICRLKKMQMHEKHKNGTEQLQKGND